MNEKRPTAAGKSSFDLIDHIDQERFWKYLSLQPGITVMDLGCGSGRYALPLAQGLGADGKVIAVDAWEDGIAQLQAKAAELEVHNIETHVADARKLPLANQSVDLCLMATVLHDFVADNIAKEVLREMIRVLTPQGILAVVEFQKKDGPPGPPKAIRLAIEDVAVMLQPLGFIRFSAIAELGPHLYFSQFRRLGGRR